ncbi:MAG: OmpA family protein [Myxococcales bacterium]|nr:OmpA family protein [Myxococcales bacterium]
MIGLLWTVAAMAAEGPEVAIGLTTAIGNQTFDQRGWLGLQGGIHQPLPVWDRRLTLGGRFRSGASLRGEPFLALEPVARLFLANRDDTTVAASLGAGVHFADEPVAVISPGLTVDVGRAPSIRPRFEGAVHYRPGPGEWRLSLTSGIVWRDRPPPPEPEPVPEPEPEPEPEPIADGGMLWFGAPVCAWLEPEQVIEATRLGKLEGPPLTTFDSSGPRAYGSTPAAPIDQVGNLVIAAWPGDVIRVDGQPVQTDASGFAVINQPEGDVSVEVVGGGRRLDLPLSVADRHALWVAADPPQPIGVRFPVAISTLDDDARATVARVASAAGTWMLEVRGGASPEGDPERNAQLSVERAQAVAQALRDAGVPDDHIRVAEELDIFDPETDPPEHMRAAIVYPVLEEAP